LEVKRQAGGYLEESGSGGGVCLIPEFHKLIREKDHQRKGATNEVPCVWGKLVSITIVTVRVRVRVRVRGGYLESREWSGVRF